MYFRGPSSNVVARTKNLSQQEAWQQMRILSSEGEDSYLVSAYCIRDIYKQSILMADNVI